MSTGIHVKSTQRTPVGSILAPVLAAGLALLALCASVLDATPVVSETWDTPGSLDGWINNQPGSSSLSNQQGYLSIYLPELTVPSPGLDIIRTGPGSLSGFAGNYPSEHALYVTFDFFAQDYQPEGLALYFATDTDSWFLPLDLPSVGVWTDYRAFFDYSVGWIGEPGTDGSTFTNDLNSVAWIGVGIDRTYAGCTYPPAQVYGLDDFQLETPEPGTYMMLASVLLSALTVFRRQIHSRWLAFLGSAK
jgi:hypothetical protein